jgi:hypothetical protein
MVSRRRVPSGVAVCARRVLAGLVRDRQRLGQFEVVEVDVLGVKPERHGRGRAGHRRGGAGQQGLQAGGRAQMPRHRSEYAAVDDGGAVEVPGEREERRVGRVQPGVAGRDPGAAEERAVGHGGLGVPQFLPEQARGSGVVPGRGVLAGGRHGAAAELQRLGGAQVVPLAAEDLRGFDIVLRPQVDAGRPQGGARAQIQCRRLPELSCGLIAAGGRREAASPLPRPGIADLGGSVRPSPRAPPHGAAKPAADEEGDGQQDGDGEQAPDEDDLS